MTDTVTAAPIAIRPFRLLRFTRPNVAFGPTVAKLAEAISQASHMAYVAPFSAMQERPSSVLDEELEGRDPNW